MTLGGAAQVAAYVTEAVFVAKVIYGIV